MSGAVMATWWQLGGGFCNEPGPLRGAEEEELRLATDDVLESNGYSLRHVSPYDVGGPIEVIIWEHQTLGLCVQLGHHDVTLASYFVRQKHKDAFMATEYLHFIKMAMHEREISALELIGKAGISAIRHGIGRATISADGLTSRDDAEQHQRWARSRANTEREIAEARAERSKLAAQSA